VKHNYGHHSQINSDGLTERIGYSDNNNAAVKHNLHRSSQINSDGLTERIDFSEWWNHTLGKTVSLSSSMNTQGKSSSMIMPTCQGISSVGSRTSFTFARSNISDQRSFKSVQVSVVNSRSPWQFSSRWNCAIAIVETLVLDFHLLGVAGKGACQLAAFGRQRVPCVTNCLREGVATKQFYHATFEGG
jgi:hypothetical protein